MRVLVVEDDLRTASLLRRGLAEEGYAVDVAPDGPQAVWRAAAFSYDAVVLDVMLPGMDGFEVCRKIRAGGCWAPVLMLTARGVVADRIRGLDAGADDYLAKPFNFGELCARLRALLRRGTPVRPALLEAGDLRLDPATRQAWRGSVELELSPREFAASHHGVQGENPGEQVGAGEQAGNSDGPGGHADPPGNVQHEFNGVE